MATAVLLLITGWVGPSSAQVLDLTSQDQPHNPVPYLEYLRDPQGLLSPEEVRHAADSGQFQALPSADEAVNFGFTRDVIWYRLQLRPSGPPTLQDWVLEVGYNLLNRIDIFVVRGDGQLTQQYTGNTAPSSGDLLLNRNFSFVLDLQPEEPTQLLIRAQTDTSHLLSMSLWQEHAYASKLSRDNFWFGMFFGLMLVMVLYNLLIVSAVRDRSYLFYIAYALSGAAFYFVLNGFARYWLGPWPPTLWPAVPILIGLQSFFGLLFAQSFLQTRRNAPTMHRMISALILITALVIMSCPFVSISLGLQWVAALGVVLACIILGTGIFAAWLGVTMARLFVLAFGCFALGVVLKVFAAAGLFPSGFWTTYGMQIGQAMDVVLLSLALADRINITRREREESRVAMLQALRNKDAAVVLERERILRDLHDDIGAKILSIVHGPAEEEDKQLARDALIGIRALALSPSDLRKPLKEVLALIQLEFDDRLLRAGIKPTWHQSGDTGARQLKVQDVANLANLVREVVSNAIKHSGGQQVSCQLDLEDSWLRLRIEDDGGPASPDSWQAGKGLETMQHRAEELSATLDLSVASHGGLAVNLRMPLAAAV